jgi:hypothetical protein
MRRAAFIALGLAGLVVIPASAQSLAARIGEVRDGYVRFAYASRPDVCGNGANNIHTGNGRHVRSNADDDYDYPCEYGPVRVRLAMSDGQVSRIRVSVGGRLRENAVQAVDLGLVSTREAASYLLDLARRSRSRAGGEAIFAVTLADSVTPWPDMLRIARDESVREETRKQSVFWLGQAAGDAATQGLSELAEDDDEDQEVRESAVFALSQLSDDEGVPVLIRIARSNKDPKIRRTALFWLGQSDDPRALDLFEELLAKN